MRIHVSLITRFLQKMLKLPLAFFYQKTTGDILQRIHDQQRVEQLLTNGTLTFIFSIFSLLLPGDYCYGICQPFF
ncbi:MAG: ABC transporter transmembrane domain-containing protein [Saprospiraceae bacterium]